MQRRFNLHFFLLILNLSTAYSDWEVLLSYTQKSQKNIITHNKNISQFHLMIRLKVLKPPKVWRKEKFDFFQILGAEKSHNFNLVKFQFLYHIICLLKRSGLFYAWDIFLAFYRFFSSVAVFLDPKKSWIHLHSPNHPDKERQSIIKII